MSAKGKKRPATLDHLKKKKSRPEKKIPICLDSSLAADVEEAQTEVGRLELQLHMAQAAVRPQVQAQLDLAKAKLEEAEAAADEQTVWMHFRSIGGQAYDDLLAQHPPTPEQEKKAAESNSRAVYNADTFLPALIAASVVEPVMTPEDVNELFDEWNGNESMLLWATALEVNTSNSAVNWGKG